jgi:hypothetical protein
MTRLMIMIISAASCPGLPVALAGPRHFNSDSELLALASKLEVFQLDLEATVQPLFEVRTVSSLPVSFSG